MIRRNARSARARFRAAAATSAADSLAERAIREGANPPCGLEAAADQQRRRPRDQLPALVSAQCPARKQPRESRPLRALLREQPTK